MQIKADCTCETNTRKKEVISVFLSVLMRKGLSETTVRDLSFSINNNSGGLYTYFKSKEEAVIACAQEAAVRLERGIVVSALCDSGDIETILKNAIKRSDKFMPEMQLLVQISTTPKYISFMQPTLDMFAERYKVYTEKFAEKFGCSPEEIEPYVYMCITIFSNYLTFGKKSFTYLSPQLKMVKEAVEKIVNKEAFYEKDI